MNPHPKLFLPVIPVIMIFSLLAPARAADRPDMGDGHSLDIPGKGNFQSIEISFSSWDGDAEGISLDADGNLRTWSRDRSGMTGQYPPGEMAFSLPPGKVDKLVRLLGKPGVLEDVASKKPGDSRADKRVSTVRSVTTTGGVFKLTSSEDSMQAEALLNKMRFYIPQVGIMEWLQVDGKREGPRAHFLRLTSDSVLVKQPKRRAVKKTRRGWFVPEIEVFALIDALEGAKITSAGKKILANMLTDEGRFRIGDNLDEISSTLVTFYKEQTGLSLGPERRFEKLVLSLNHAGSNVYFIEIDASGRLEAGCGTFPELCPIEVSEGREELILDPGQVYELVTFLKRPAIRRLAVSSFATTSLPDETEMEIQVLFKKRDENPAIFEDNIEVYQYQQNGLENLVDKKRRVEKFLVTFYKKARAEEARKAAEEEAAEQQESTAVEEGK